jgi:hypothetical protein
LAAVTNQIGTAVAARAAVPRAMKTESIDDPDESHALLARRLTVVKQGRARR